MTLLHFDIGDSAAVAIDLNDSDLRLRILELSEWSKFTQSGLAKFRDSAGTTRALAPDHVRNLVAQVRARQLSFP
jgi:hypothetical protein